MQELITIQIIRPQIDGLSDSDKKAFIECMAKDIAEQIIKQEALRRLNENIQHWQETLLRWDVEDKLRRING